MTSLPSRVDQLGLRERDVLHERRRLEQLHEARERLDVDGVADDLELERGGRRRRRRRRRLALVALRVGGGGAERAPAARLTAVWTMLLSHVYGGSARLTSSMTCGQTKRSLSMALMMSSCAEHRVALRFGAVALAQDGGEARRVLHGLRARAPRARRPARSASRAASRRRRRRPTMAHDGRDHERVLDATTRRRRRCAASAEAGAASLASRARSRLISIIGVRSR